MPTFAPSAPADSSASDARSQATWNLNTHYHPLILDAVPAHARTALDVGCGDGQLSIDLAGAGFDVTGIDVDGDVLARAHERIEAAGAARISLRQQSVLDMARAMAHELAGDGQQFDVVTSVAMLHHIDAVDGLRAMRQLVKPGGTVIIVGFALVETPLEHALAAAGLVRKCYEIVRGRFWHHSAPISWPPPLTFASMRRLADGELPGNEFLRLLGGRYAIIWTAPS